MQMRDDGLIKKITEGLWELLKQMEEEEAKVAEPLVEKKWLPMHLMDCLCRN